MEKERMEKLWVSVHHVPSMLQGENRWLRVALISEKAGVVGPSEARLLANVAQVDEIFEFSLSPELRPPVHVRFDVVEADGRTVASGELLSAVMERSDCGEVVVALQLATSGRFVALAASYLEFTAGPASEIARGPKRPLDMLTFGLTGHRGSGAHPSAGVVRKVRHVENTLQSFHACLEAGKSSVEFDVHLTKDGIPVIYHDFVLSLHDISPELPDLVVPINTVRADLFTALRPKASDQLYSESFPTFEQMFSLPTRLGFDVELKYPCREEAVKYAVHFDTRTRLVDATLDVVFANAAQTRPLYFSSFDPDVCALLAHKQKCFPVLLLTKGSFAKVSDRRRTSLAESFRFARRAGLDGLVCYCEELMNNAHLIPEFKAAGFVIATYGEWNNDPEYVAKERLAGVDCIISDSIEQDYMSLVLSK